MTQWARHLGSRRGTVHAFDVQKTGLARVRAVSRCGNAKISCSPRDLEAIEGPRCPTCLSLMKDQAEPSDNPLAGFSFEDITPQEAESLGLVVGDNTWRVA